MKIWVDDIRKPPDDWQSEYVWAKTSESAIVVLNRCKKMNYRPEFMSLDHDLGGDDTSRPIILWCCENEFWPVEIRVHSANPVGIEWLEGMVKCYKV